MEKFCYRTETLERRPRASEMCFRQFLVQKTEKTIGNAI